MTKGEHHLTEEIIEEDDHPIMEKGEHSHDVFDELENPYDFERVAGGEDEYQDAEHFSPEKGEHHDEAEKFWDLEEDYEDAEHDIPEKSEHYVDEVHHLPKDVWKPQFHGDEDPRHHYEHDEGDEEEFGHGYNHHYQHEDGIDDKYLDGLPKGTLTPKQPSKDDPRLMIPKGRATPEHDHLIVPKEPHQTAEH